MTGQKSGNIQYATEKEIKGVLKYVMVKIGLRATNWPSDEEKAVLLIHIIEHYGDSTIEDIKTAFDMAITGQLDVDANCFENFSCLYFSKIMNAYKNSMPYIRKKHIESFPPPPIIDKVNSKCSDVYQMVLLRNMELKPPLKWFRG